MALRFADLPVRTKFLITLGIPVLGLVLLIGKQVSSSLKRRDVLRYISVQAKDIRLLGDVVDALQREGSASIARLEGIDRSPQRLAVRRSATDDAVKALSDPALMLDPEVRPVVVLATLTPMRLRVDADAARQTDVEQEYHRMETQLLDYIGPIFRQALDPETNQKLFAHLSLLNAKQALGDTRTRLMIAFDGGPLDADADGDLDERITQYETNSLLFRRDAPPDVRAFYARVFRGEEVNFMRSVIGTMHQRGATLAPPREEWWRLANIAMDKLRAVEEFSINAVIAGAEANSRDAQQRLIIVLLALAGVVGAVTVMAIVIMRGIRNTVEEVTTATGTLALGDVRAHVPVTSNDEIGQMARTFNGMIDNIRSLAASADAIGKGNYDMPVPLRSEQDVLGHALNRMRDNLKAARERDHEQNLALQREKEKLERANERIRVLIKEIHHRVKNNLQVVASLLRLQSGTIEDERLQQVFAQSQNRVASMALIHEKLYKGDDLVQLDIAQYITELFAELVRLNDVRETIRCTASVDPDLSLDLDTMVPLGLVLNELITNSFKHAFTDRPRGNIDLRLHRTGEREFNLLYSDDGSGMAPEKLAQESGTLGMGLIDSLTEQLNGYLTVESDATGTRYHIRFKTR